MSWFTMMAKDPGMRYILEAGRAQKAAKDQAWSEIGGKSRGMMGVTRTMLGNPEGFKSYMQQFGKPKEGPNEWFRNYAATTPPPPGMVADYFAKYPGSGTNLASLNGMAPPASMMPPAAPPTQSSGGTQRMIAPDGSQRDVPAAHVQHYLGLGGRLA